GIYHEEYHYDPAGNMTSLTHRNSGNPWTRHYGMSGLTPQQWEQEWTTHLTPTDSWPSPPGNQLTHVGDDQPSVLQNHFYDSNGNMIRENNDRHFEWDYADRMRTFRSQVAQAEPPVYAQYLYDAGRQR